MDILNNLPEELVREVGSYMDGELLSKAMLLEKPSYKEFIIYRNKMAREPFEDFMRYYYKWYVYYKWYYKLT